MSFVGIVGLSIGGDTRDGAIWRYSGPIVKADGESKPMLLAGKK